MQAFINEGERGKFLTLVDWSKCYHTHTCTHTHTHNFTLSGHCPTLYTVYTHSQRLQQHAVRILLNGKSNINPSITFRNWKRAKHLPFYYWFRENEFHRLSLQCLHARTLRSRSLWKERQKQRKSQSCAFWTQTPTDFGLHQRRERGGFRSERTLSFWKPGADEISYERADEGEIGQQKSTKTVNEIHRATSEFH